MRVGLKIVDSDSDRAGTLKSTFESAGIERVAVHLQGENRTSDEFERWETSQAKLTIAHWSDVSEEEGVDVFYTTQFKRPERLDQVWIWRDVPKGRDVPKDSQLSAKEAEEILEWACNDKKWKDRPAILRPRSVQPILTAIAVLAQAALRAKSKRTSNTLRSRGEWLRLLLGAGPNMNALLGQLGQEWPEALQGQEKYSRLLAFVEDLDSDDRLAESTIRDVLTLAQWGLR